MLDNFIKKETLVHIFSCEFWLIFYIFFLQTPLDDYFFSFLKY